MSNFTEELFDAIQLITDKTLSKIEMDKTIICRITDASKKSEGKYRVRNNDLSFWAFCENDTYAEGDEVRVVIPSDTTAQKYIIGKYVSDDGSPVAYVSPADSVINISGNLYKSEDGNLRNLQAAKGLDKYTILWSAGSDYAGLLQNGIYDSIVVEGDFRTLLNDDRTGEFGIEIHIFVESDSVIQDFVYSLTSAEMFGDPYNFQIYTPQSKVFVLPTGVGESVRVTNIVVSYFQEGFSNTISKDFHNVQIRNFAVWLGSDASSIPDNTSKIYTNDSLSYVYNDASQQTNSKTLNLLWYKKDDSGRVTQCSFEPRDALKDIEVAQTDIKVKAQMGREGGPETLRALYAAAAKAANSSNLSALKKLVVTDLKQLIRTFESQAGIGSDKIQFYEEESESEKNLWQAGEDIGDYINKLNGWHSKLITNDWSELPAEANIIVYMSSQMAHVDDFFSQDLTIITDEKNILYGKNGVFDIYKAKWLLLKAQINAYLNRLHVSTLFSYPVSDMFNNKDYWDSDGNKFTKYWIEKQKINSSGEIVRQGENDSEADKEEDDKESNDSSLVSCTCYWFKYNGEYLGDDVVKSIAGAYWEPVIDENGAYAQTTSITQYMDEKSEAQLFKCIVFVGNNYYESNILTFTNSEEIPDTATLDKADSLIINHGNNSRDTYLLYGDDSYLVESYHKNMYRTLTLSYEGVYSGDEVLHGAGAFWYIPIANSMLVCDDAQLKKQGFVEETSTAWANKHSGYKCYYRQIIDANHDNEDITTIDFGDTNKFIYRIKDFYEPSASVNSIICEVSISNDRDPVYAETWFTFGQKGTSGTSYTLSVTPEGSQVATTDSTKLTLNVELFDVNGDLQPLSSNILKAKWINHGGSGGLNVSCDTDAKRASITIDETSYGILQISVSQVEIETKKAITDENGEEGYETTTRYVDVSMLYSVPYSKINTEDEDTYLFSGPTKIIYTTLGALDYTNLYNVAYALHDRAGADIGSNNQEDVDYVVWELITEGVTNSLDYNFYPSIVLDKRLKRYYLEPVDMYMSDLTGWCYAQASYKEEVYWKQPIIITQSKYSSAVLNDWDGTFSIDETNGTVMGTMFAAGRKTTNNTFEGVIMGDVQTGLQDAKQGMIGLYGYNDGIQSFGLKIDGTAFFGKPGAGQILMNGNEGSIQSGLYSTDEDGNCAGGMKIDLTQGIIDSYNYKFDSHRPTDVDSNGNLYNNGESFYHVNIETSPIDTDEYVARPNTTSFKFKTGIKYYELKDGEYVEYTGTSYPTQTVLYKKVVDYKYTKQNRTNIIKDSDDNKIDGELNSGTYYIYKDSTGYSLYKWKRHPTYYDLYSRGEVETYEAVGKDAYVNDGSVKYYVKNDSGEYVDYTGDSYPEEPLLYEKVTKDKGFYHVRFSSDGELELSIANGTELADSGLNLGDYTGNVEDKFTSIEDNLIGTPGSLTRGSVYNYLEGQIENIEDEVLGIPKGIEMGSIYDYIQGQITHIENEVIGLPSSVSGATSMKSYIDAQSYLTGEKVFNGLTDGGKRKGLFYRTVSSEVPSRRVETKTIITADGIEKTENVYNDDDGSLSFNEDSTTTEELYINASYIRTGILTSENWAGKLIYAKEGYDDKIYESVDEAWAAISNNDLPFTDGKWELRPTEGTYWDLNNGKMWAAKFELNAWRDNEGNITTGSGASGLYINSHPDEGQYYLSLGHVGGENDTYIQYSQEGTLTIKLNEFILDALARKKDESGIETGEGIYFNSNPDDEDSYFWVGNSNNFIRFTKQKDNDEFIIQIGDNGIYHLNAWTVYPKNNVSGYGYGIYINNNPNTNVPYFRAGEYQSTIENGVSGITGELLQVYKDKVQIFSNHFMLGAWDDTNGGLFLKSNPDGGNDYYLSVGKPDSFIQLNGEGEIKIRASDLWLQGGTLTADNQRFVSGFVLDSNPTKNSGYYLMIGDNNNFLSFREDGEFVIQVASDDASDDKKGKFVLNAWDSNGDYGSGIYINNKPDSNGYYFRAGCYSSADDVEILQISQDKVQIFSNHFMLGAWDDTNGGLFLNSNPTGTGNDYYLSVGKPDSFIQLNNDGLNIKSKNFTFYSGDFFITSTNDYSYDSLKGGKSYVRLGQTSAITNNTLLKETYSSTETNGCSVDIEVEGILALVKEGLYTDKTIKVKINSSSFSFNSQGESKAGISLTGSFNKEVTLTAKITTDGDSKINVKISASAASLTTSVSYTLTIEVGYYGVSKDYSFAILEDGSMYLRNAKVSGEIEATGGSLGGFTIGDTLYTLSKTFYNTATEGVCLSSDGIGLGTNFTVDKNGYLNCLRATIGSAIFTTAKIEFNSDSQDIGNPSIRSTYKPFGNSTDINQFYLSAGAGLAFSSYTTGSKDAGLIVNSRGIYYFISKDSSHDDPWNLINTPDMTTQTPLITFQNSEIGIGTALTINDSVMCYGEGYASNGLYLQLDCLNSSVRLGIKESEKWCGEIYMKSGLMEIKSTLNIQMDGQLYFNKEAYISNAGNNTAQLHGTWKADSGEVIDSDLLIKNTINDIRDSYSSLFDSLQPVTYKLNNGTSNRTHTGFIAQDVKSAIEAAGLTTQDFAGYCEWENDDPNSASCGLRYEEFIPLCVNEIQKLKKRVAELEGDNKKN